MFRSFQYQQGQQAHLLRTYPAPAAVHQGYTSNLGMCTAHIVHVHHRTHCPWLLKQGITQQLLQTASGTTTFLGVTAVRAAYLGKCDVTDVCEWCDHQPLLDSQILIAVLKIHITDRDDCGIFVIPPVEANLLEPFKVCWVANLRETGTTFAY